MADQKQSIIPMMCIQEIQEAMSTNNMRRILNQLMLSCEDLVTSQIMMSLKFLSKLKILNYRGPKELGSNRIITISIMSIIQVRR